MGHRGGQGLTQTSIMLACDLTLTVFIVHGDVVQSSHASSLHGKADAHPDTSVCKVHPEIKGKRSETVINGNIRPFIPPQPRRGMPVPDVVVGGMWPVHLHLFLPMHLMGTVQNKNKLLHLRDIL